MVPITIRSSVSVCIYLSPYILCNGGVLHPSFCKICELLLLPFFFWRGWVGCYLALPIFSNHYFLAPLLTYPTLLFFSPDILLLLYLSEHFRIWTSQLTTKHYMAHFLHLGIFSLARLQQVPLVNQRALCSMTARKVLRKLLSS